MHSEAAAGRHRILEQGVQRDVLERTVRVLLDGFVHILVAAEALVDAVLLRHDLAGTCGSSSFVALRPARKRRRRGEALRGDDADMARGEGLAHDAGVEHGHGLVRHAAQAVVAAG